MGDAVYEQFIREKIIKSGSVYGGRADLLHKEAVKYVRASAQCAAIKHILESGVLSEEEASVVRRARNHKTATKPQNAGAIEYKYATAFEALLGYLHLGGKAERALEIMEMAYSFGEAQKLPR